jgi:hypothetical protein
VLRIGGVGALPSKMTDPETEELPANTGSVDRVRRMVMVIRVNFILSLGWFGIVARKVAIVRV